MAKVLTKKERLRLSQLLSADEESKQLALTIINRCDISKSFAEILILINEPGAFNSIRLMSSEVIVQSNVHNYVVELLNNVIIDIPLKPSVSFLVSLWDKHCAKHKFSRKEWLTKRKYIVYNLEDNSPSMKPLSIQLNPKKNVRKKS